MMINLTCLFENYVNKVPKFMDIRNFGCNLPKMRTKRQTLGYFGKKMPME